MLAANVLKYALALLLFVVLPIALVRFMVYKTIDIPRRNRD